MKEKEKMKTRLLKNAERRLEKQQLKVVAFRPGWDSTNRNSQKN